VRSGWAVAAALVILVASRDADAFCRTTTSPIPAGYDPTAKGCWRDGHPIAWLWDQRVSYELDASASKQIDLAEATRAVDAAFAKWNTAVCPDGLPNVTAVNGGPVAAGAVAAECRTTPCDPTAPGAYHLVVFRDAGWGYDDPANTLALTTVTYAVDSGVLFNAEIEINSHDHKLTTVDPPPPGAFDLQTIITHEAGHFLGLAHATSQNAVMYAYYSQGSRELTADDVAGLCAMYPPQGGGGGMACGVGGRKSNRWPVAVAVGLVLLGLVRRRR
jgi:hypothetical protein